MAVKPRLEQLARASGGRTLKQFLLQKGIPVGEQRPVMTVYKLRIALENAGCAIAESQRPGSLLCKEGRGLVVHFSEGSGLLEHLIVLLKDRHLPHGDLDFTEITTLWRRLQTRRR